VDEMQHKLTLRDILSALSSNVKLKETEPKRRQLAIALPSIPEEQVSYLHCGSSLKSR